MAAAKSIKYKKSFASQIQGSLRVWLGCYSHYYGFAGKKNENNALGSPRVKKGIQHSSQGVGFRRLLSKIGVDIGDTNETDV